MDLDSSKRLVEEAKNAGVNVHEKTLVLKKILGFLTENSIPIVLVDWNVIINKKEKGYQGHFVPVVGYDNQNVYVHDPEEQKGFKAVQRNIFDKARKADGTDEDIVVVYRKTPK